MAVPAARAGGRVTAQQAAFAPSVVRFFVPGTAEPQGSARGFVVNGRAVITTDNPHLKAWRKEIAKVCHGMRERPISEPVRVRCQFRFERPPSVPKSRLYPATRPDLDKLTRGLLDGMCEPVKRGKREGGGETTPLIKEDSLVVDLLANKRYAGPGQQPGVLVEVEVLPGRA